MDYLDYHILFVSLSLIKTEASNAEFAEVANNIFNTDFAQFLKEYEIATIIAGYVFHKP